jgi:integrase
MTTRKSLSDKGVAALRPRAARYAFPDPELVGHYVRVQSSGAKSFVAVSRSPAGKQIWTTVGSTEVLSIAEARERAREIIKRVQAGRSAIEPKAQTFGAVTASWLQRHVTANSLVSERQIRRLLDTHVLPRWRDRELVAIGRADLTALLDQIEDRHGARQSDLCLTIIRSLMNWHSVRVDNYHPPVVRGMRRQSPTAQARARVLDDDEIRAIWKACESTTFGAIVRMCLLTAQRSRKVAGMRWADLDSDVWTVPRLPREKDTGGALLLPEAAQQIIAERPQLAGNPFVFASVRGTAPYTGFSAGKLALDAKLPMGTAPWTIHDLRRTARSLMARAGVPSEHAERVMGHAIGGIQHIYDRHAYLQEKRDALARLAALIDGIVHPRGADVVPLARPRKHR